MTTTWRFGGSTINVARKRRRQFFSKKPFEIARAFYNDDGIRGRRSFTVNKYRGRDLGLVRTESIKRAFTIIIQLVQLYIRLRAFLDGARSTPR